MDTNKRLRDARKRADYTQVEAASAVGKSQGYIADLESGRHQPNVWELLRELAQLYHVTTDYLLGLTEQTAPSAGQELDPETWHIVGLFRQMEPEKRRELVAIAGALLQSQREEAAAREREFVELVAMLRDIGGDALVAQISDLLDRLLVTRQHQSDDGQ